MAKFLVHIYIAAPGTPLKLDGGTSLPGHMFYVIESGGERKSYGLAPVTHGQINGLGQVYDKDERNYQDPFYRRTLEITQAHYQQLKDFGENPGRFGFSTYYQDARNNCVDFTWAALNHAGIHATEKQGGQRGHPVKIVPRPKHEGSLKPTKNIDDVQSIQPPVPGSLDNKERRNPMPKQSNLQWILSENRKSSFEHRV